MITPAETAALDQARVVLDRHLDVLLRVHADLVDGRGRTQGECDLVAFFAESEQYSDIDLSGLLMCAIARLTDSAR